MTLKLEDLPSYASDGLNDHELRAANNLLGHVDQYLAKKNKAAPWKNIALLVVGFLVGAAAGVLIPRSEEGHDHAKPAVTAPAATTAGATASAAPTATTKLVEVSTEPQPLPEVRPLPEAIQAGNPRDKNSGDSVRGNPAYNGEWVSREGRPLPTATIEAQRDGSKTPFNLRFRDVDDLEGGCGFYATGTAYCKVHDKKNKEVPKSLVTHVEYFDDGDPEDGTHLLLVIEDVGTFALKKKAK